MPMPSATALVWAALLKDVMTILGAGVAIYVALRGLSAWRRQLKGNVQYELARRLLTNVYRARDALHAVRALYVPTSETLEPV